MATIVRNRNGKQVVLLDPQEKRDKYFAELKAKTKMTANGVKKVDSKGKPMKLKEREIGYRLGYIAAQNESAKIYNAKKAKRKRK